MTMRSSRHPFPRELARSLSHDPVRQTLLKRVWDLLDEDNSSVTSAPAPEEAWAAIESALDTEGQPRRASDRGPRVHIRRRLMVGTAAALSLMLIGVLFWQRPSTFDAGPGVQRTVVLSDGSAIHLNSASRVAHVRGFKAFPMVRSAARTVRLEGEAFFEVSTQPDRPFIVQTANARIEVLGTRFNVRARPHAGIMETVVTLEEGRVSVASELWRSGGGEAAILDSVGAAYVVRADGLPELRPRKASLESMLAWRERGFAAVDEPVGSILRELELRFAVRISIEAGLDVDTPMSVFYQRDTSPEEIIHDICLERGWYYRPLSRGYAIFEAQQLPLSSPDVNV